MKKIFTLFLLFFSLTVLAQNTGFRKVYPKSSNIYFRNDINEGKEVNIMMYDYLYNGGGVGIGDFNNDGFQDIFFTGNMVMDRLYINEGDFKFRDITEQAGINSVGWSTGVLVVDINNDGWDDIYVCRSGWFEEEEKLKNVLYINQGLQNGEISFKEAAATYGLDHSGHHTMAAPLDYDLDGDLDLYLLGHPGSFSHSANFKEAVMNIQAGKVESDVLLENVDGKYIEVTKKAGIFEYGYGLGLAITDINQDGYPDIIVCNDFDEPDHVFVNQKNKTFKDESLKYFKHTSNYSMGNDVGDINNDGLLDFISVDMAYQSHERSKMNMASMNPDKFFARLALGWNRQYMHNVLQLNTGKGVYQEIAHFAGIAKTDWSWAPLIFDIDMDGWQDLFISNGYKRDTKNNDLAYLVEQEKEKKGDLSIHEFLNLIPSVQVENFFYRNDHRFKFEDKRGDWGIDEKLNSNGAAYVDLDNDGDLDLVLNNVDTAASVYENITDSKSHFIKVDLSGLNESEYLGMKFFLNTYQTYQMREAYFVRGFQSTVERAIYFHWAETDRMKKFVIELPSGRRFFVPNMKPDKVLKLTSESFADFEVLVPKAEHSTLFNDVTNEYKIGHIHKENEFNDFENETLLPHKISTHGPQLAVEDFNKDGLEDFIVTSSEGQIPTVYIQTNLGTFKKVIVPSFYNHQRSEEGGVYVFDVNGDGNKDLFMSSGGYQFDEGDTSLQDRLYIGNGLGTFGFVKNAIEQDFVNSGKVIGEDMDNDGDIDFLICGDAFPKKYPYAGKTVILENFSKFFKVRTQKIAPQLERIGIVKDAVFSDYDLDGDRDLIVVGEWMGVEFFKNTDGRFIQEKNKMDIKGWWSTIEAVDIDNDGDDDYLLGNVGMNNKFNATKENPLDVYANDFDDNGTLDIVLAKRKDDKNLPVRGRECSSTQMPFIEQKFPTYSDFARSSLEDIYSKEKLERSLHLIANEFQNGILYNNDKGENFDFRPFSAEGQWSFINDFVVLDINGDEKLDIIAVGNRFEAEVETTSYDASCGLVFIQTANGNFEFIPALESGFFAPYNAKSMELIHLGQDQVPAMLIGNNNGPIQLFQLGK